MFNIYDKKTAQQTILKRVAADEMSIPPSVQHKIKQTFGKPLTPTEAVQAILSDVKNHGDIALKNWTQKIDQVSLDEFRIPPQAFQDAINQTDQALLDTLQTSIERVAAFHRRQPFSSWLTQDLGGTLGQLLRPIRRVGLYVPGGSAPLPSSVIMSAVPAQVAGVKEIAVVTPPNPQFNYFVHPIILAACVLVGINEVYTIGGAQAIAALAYGTQQIPAVDKIFGPGNLFVTLAKKQVYGVVGIDGLFGPTETMVIADESARPAWIAADLLAQAEHDVLASATLLTPSMKLAEEVQQEVLKQLAELPRKEIAAEALQARSGAVIVADLNEAVDLANQYGAEHLCLAVSNPWDLVEKIQNAGGVFLGEFSFEVLGDYIAGPSHVMPTSGSARFSSPLNVWDFLHIINLVALEHEYGKSLSHKAAVLARAELLEAHARAADFRTS